MKEGRSLNSEDPVWKEAEKAVLSGPFDYKEVQLAIHIDRNWLDTLKELIEQILVSSPASPTEALEVAIFNQIKQQLEV